jgi:dUTP pyrophosphatase
MGERSIIRDEKGCYVQSGRKKLKSDLNQLVKKNFYDAGLDILSSENIIIAPNSSSLISTQLFVEIPDGHVGLLWSRSGLSVKYKIEVGAGCIDSSYRGEVKVHLYNFSDKPFTVLIGDRVAQMLTIPICLQSYAGVDSLSSTDRGDKGFGSTGGFGGEEGILKADSTGI